MSRRALAVGVIVALVVTGCAAPSKQYVNADSYGMFLSLPREWVQVPDQQLKTAQSGWSDDPGQVFTQTVLWQKVWGPKGVTPDTVFSADPSDKPTAYAFVRDLLNVEQQQLGTDIATSLQDLIIPASSLADAGIAVDTEQWRKNGFVGIHQRASYPTSAGSSTTEVVSMGAPKQNRLYVLVLRCSDDCFEVHRNDFTQIVDSLTFKESRA